MVHPGSGEIALQVKSVKSMSTKGADRRSSDMEPEGRKLVIVESPAKARTIQHYLGRGYAVKASIGHVRDLLRSRLSVDIDNDFKPTYRVPKEKAQVVRELKKAAEKASCIYLATDPDREGEAIAWHVVEATGIDPARVRRVVFHEITAPAIREAFSNPRGIDYNLVDAQQARRILDRLVGYQLSPLLWQKVRSRLSAGRVQSVAVRLIVEREREIQAFTPEEYWTIDALLESQLAPGQSFRAQLQRIGAQEPALKSEGEAQAICADVEGASFVVLGVKKGLKRRQPPPPFITSTLQQEAVRRLGFPAARTMRIAQQLYEGVELPAEGATGLITYMRTDSVHLSDLAVAEIRRFISATYGDEYLPPEPRQYRTRSKLAQEAHEAIRPTSVTRTPESLAAYLSREQLALYKLIWQRALACQMQAATYDVVTAEVGATGSSGEEYVFRATGSTLRFPGFLVVLGEGIEQQAALPELAEGEELLLLALLPEQHFTQPPPRYNEASLIRELESRGIGRPSTYATIIDTILARGYVERQGKSLVPTEIAFTVTDLLVERFPEVMDVGFTAQMEDELDEIATGKKQWVPVVRSFWEPFSKELEAAKAEVTPRKVEDQPAGVNCSVCGAPMLIKYGRFGKFLGCSNYPQCRNTLPYLEKVGVRCPQCGGELVIRRSRRGRKFYGCERYPECGFSTFAEPLPDPCPACGSLMVRAGRTQARCTQCGHTLKLGAERQRQEEQEPQQP